jgi:cation:H+ antiporter
MAAMPDFAQAGLPVNFSIFAVAAAVVWAAGARIIRYANAISSKTGIGHSTLGVLLLGGITSLSEVGVVVTSAATGTGHMAVNNLLGAIFAQIAMLAIIDQMIGRNALTSALPDPKVMAQGGLNILLLAIAAAGVVVGDRAFLGAGIWAWICGAAYVSSIYILSRAKGSKAWIAAEQGRTDHRLDRQLADAQEKVNREFADRSLPRLVVGTAALALVILVAGYLLSHTGDALAQRTGLGGSFVGFVLLAFATSLPELSVSIAAVRTGLYTLAIADILGSNLINVGLILVIDLVGVGDPILNQVGAFSIFGALLGIVLTAFFVIGMAERGDKTILRMGYDSAAVLVCYSAGLIVLFSLR